MKKKLIKNLLLVLTMVVLCFAVGMTASGLEATGQCGDNVYWNYDETTGELVISGEGEMWSYEYITPRFNKGVKSVSIEEGVTSIGAYAFSECGELVDVAISDSVTFIGKWAFSGCFNLTEIYLPDSVTEMENCIFYCCINLEEVRLSNNLSGIRDGVFCYCYSLKNIVIPESVMYINDVAFANCFYLDEVVISNPKILFADYVFLSDYTSNGILTTDEWIEKCINLIKAMLTEPDNEDKLAELEDELLKYTILEPSVLSKVKIYCHNEGITYSAEAYATENGIPFEYCHFYEEEWTYDYDNMIRYRKCTYGDCDAVETENLEPIAPEEPETPETPDTPDTPTEPEVPEVTPEETVKDNLIIKLLDLIKTFLELLTSFLNR